MPPAANLTRNVEEDQLELSLSPLRGTPLFNDVLTKIKDVPGRRYVPDRKVWAVPAEPEVAERVINSIQPNCDDELREWVRLSRSQVSEALTTPLPRDADLMLPWAYSRAAQQPHSIRIGDDELPFNGLMEHQRPVVDLAARVRKLIVADDMGLGKTGTAISTVEEFRLRNPNELGELPQGPKLVVAPNSVKGTWDRELTLWLGDNEPRQVIDAGTAPKREEQLSSIIEEMGWAIVNWEQIRTTVEKRRTKAGGTRKVTVMKQPLFEKTTWLGIVADEVHRAKNRKAKQTQGLWRCRADDGIMLAMSGTPLMNSPDELWAILKWLWPKEYTAYWRFYETYVDYYETYFGKVITGVKNPDALRFELKERLVRRTQGQVLDLPGKGRHVVHVKLNPKQRKLYDEAETAIWLEVEQKAKEGDESAIKLAAAAVEGKPATDLLRMQNGASRLVRLRQIMETPATLGGEDDSAVLDACVDRIMDSRPEQWTVFCEFKPTCAALKERLERHKLVVEIYTGDVTPEDRTELEARFQRGEIDVLVGTIETMYQGITLTAANKQFWVSRSWVPARNEQGEDRQNRIGQTKRVQVFIAQPENTVATDKVAPSNRLKERIVRTVLPTDHIEERTT